MARILKALKNLQAQSLPEDGSPSTTPGSKDGSEAAGKLTMADLLASEEQNSESEVAAESPVKSEVPVSAPPAPAIDAAQLEAIEKSQQRIELLEQQLSEANLKREAVATEVHEVQQTFEKRDQRYEEEIVRLRDLLESRDDEAKKIEAQLKSELQSQQSQFAGQLEQLKAQIQSEVSTAIQANAVQTQQQIEAVQKANEQAAQAARPEPAEELVEPLAAPEAKRSSLFDKPIKSSREKQVAKADPIRKAVQDLEQPKRLEEFSQVADEMLSGIQLSTSEPTVLFVCGCSADSTPSAFILRLALVLRQREIDVLVVDGGLYQKELSDELGLLTDFGLFEMVRRESSVQDSVYRDLGSHLAFVPAGRSSYTLTDNEQDASSLRTHIAESLVDWPLILVCGEQAERSSSRLLSKVADRAYLQVELKKAMEPDVLNAIEALRASGVEPAGVIATNA